MKHIIRLGIMLVVGLAGFAVDPINDGKALQGTWIPTTAELAGKTLPQALLNTISLKLDDGKYEVFVGNEPDRGTYTLDTKSKPTGMTITGTDGPNKGKTFPAIYELKDDNLRICYDLSGTKRPAAFESLPDTKLYLVIYRRKKD